MPPHQHVTRTRRANSTPACELRHAVSSWMSVHGHATLPQFVLRSGYTSAYGSFGAAGFATKPVFLGMFPNFNDADSSSGDECDSAPGIDALLFQGQDIPPPIYWSVQSQRLDALRPSASQRTPPTQHLVSSSSRATSGEGITPLSPNQQFASSARRELKDTATSPQKTGPDTRTQLYREGRARVTRDRALDKPTTGSNGHVDPVVEKSPLFRALGASSHNSSYVEESELQFYPHVRNQLEAERAENTRLLAENAHLKEVNDRLLNDNLLLKDEVLEAKDKVRLFKGQTDQDRQMSALTLSRMRVLEEHNRELTDSVHVLQRDLDQAEERLGEISASARAEIDQKNVRLGTLAKEMTVERKAKEEADKAAEQALKQRDEAVARVRVLVREGEDAKRDKARMETEMNALREQLKKFRTRAEQAEAALQRHQRETIALVPQLELQITAGIGMMLHVVTENESNARYRLAQHEAAIRIQLLALHETNVALA